MRIAREGQSAVSLRWHRTREAAFHIAALGKGGGRKGKKKKSKPSTKTERTRLCAVECVGPRGVRDLQNARRQHCGGVAWRWGEDKCEHTNTCTDNEKRGEKRKRRSLRRDVGDAAFRESAARSDQERSGVWSAAASSRVWGLRRDGGRCTGIAVKAVVGDEERKWSCRREGRRGRRGRRMR